VGVGESSVYLMVGTCVKTQQWICQRGGGQIEIRVGEFTVKQASCFASDVGQHWAYRATNQNESLSDPEK